MSDEASRFLVPMHYGKPRSGDVPAVRRSLCMLLVCVALTGCASSGPNPVLDPVPDPVPDPASGNRDGATVLPAQGRLLLGRSVPAPEQMVAQDLVDAILQIDELSPGLRTLRMPPTRGPFDRALEQALVDSGYALERVGVTSGEGVVLSNRYRAALDPTGDIFTYVVVVGRVGLKRDYRVSGRYVEPTSSLFVRGAAPASILLNDEKFAPPS